jgi:hypothetical protein
MRRLRSPASSYCTVSGRDSSDWDVWAFKAKLRLTSGMPCWGLEVSTARTEAFKSNVDSICRWNRCRLRIPRPQCVAQHEGGVR